MAGGLYLDGDDDYLLDELLGSDSSFGHLGPPSSRGSLSISTSRSEFDPIFQRDDDENLAMDAIDANSASASASAGRLHYDTEDTDESPNKATQERKATKTIQKSVATPTGEPSFQQPKPSSSSSSSAPIIHTQATSRLDAALEKPSSQEPSLSEYLKTMAIPSKSSSSVSPYGGEGGSVPSLGESTDLSASNQSEPVSATSITDPTTAPNSSYSESLDLTPSKAVDRSSLTLLTDPMTPASPEESSSGRDLSEWDQLCRQTLSIAETYADYSQHEESEESAFLSYPSISTVLELNDNIQVAIRLEPTDEHVATRQNGTGRPWLLVRHEPYTSIVECGVPIREGANLFHFDRIFEQETDAQVYRTIGRPVVHAVVEGHDGTIICYGAKHNSLYGDNGFIRLLAIHVFRRLDAMREEFKLRLEQVEVYNETIRELQNKPIVVNAKKEQPKVQHNGAKLNCLSTQIWMPDDVLKLVQKGNRRRVRNKDGKCRGHSIVRLAIERRIEGELQTCYLNVVDLASPAGGDGRLEKFEQAMINKSLFTLSQVIHAQRLPKRPHYINYRDSKLTRLLQPHISAKESVVSFLCFGSSARSDLEETRSTLRFAARAKCVEIQVDLGDIEYMSYLIWKYRNLANLWTIVKMKWKKTHSN